MRATVRISLAVLAAVLAVPSSAAAAVTATSDTTNVTITGDGSADTVDVGFTVIGTGPAARSGVRVASPGGVVPGPGCVAQSPNAAACTFPSRGIVANLGAGDDRFNASTFYDLPTNVSGEAGNDALSGGDEAVLNGGEGGDTLRAMGFGGERLVGGPGNDTASFPYSAYATIGGTNTGFSYATNVDPDVERLEGGSGYDDFFVGPNAGTGHTFVGGAGEDSISYSASGAPVAVTLDGAANDGVGGRTDNVGGDFENVYGTPFEDGMVGNDASNTLSGGGGNDHLVGDPGAGGAADTLIGGDGNDTLEGRGGEDTLQGLAGNDTIDGGGGGDGLAGGPGSDVMRGGGDTDSVSYEGLSGPVNVTLDDVPNDGGTDERDLVGGDVERIVGTELGDTLVGNDGDNDLRGGSGNDRVDGGGGRDNVHGGDGEDTVLGGAGPDELRGGSGDDALDGGPGEDSLIGQEIQDGRAGLDVLEMRDGERDTAACPEGIQRVMADQYDLVAPSCQLVERTQIGSGGPPILAPQAAAPPLRVVRQRVRADRRGFVRIKASCPPGPACSGVLYLFARRGKREVQVVRTAFAVPAARKRTIRVRLAPLGRRMLRRRKVLRVELAVAAASTGAEVKRLVALRIRRR